MHSRGISWFCSGNRGRNKCRFLGWCLGWFLRWFRSRMRRWFGGWSVRGLVGGFVGRLPCCVIRSMPIRFRVDKFISFRVTIRVLTWSIRGFVGRLPCCIIRSRQLGINMDTFISYRATIVVLTWVICGLVSRLPCCIARSSPVRINVETFISHRAHSRGTHLASDLSLQRKDEHYDDKRKDRDARRLDCLNLRCPSDDAHIFEWLTWLGIFPNKAKEMNTNMREIKRAYDNPVSVTESYLLGYFTGTVMENPKELLVGRKFERGCRHLVVSNRLCYIPCFIILKCLAESDRLIVSETSL